MTTVILMGIGAALMYFFDPDSGQHRRVRLRDQCMRATKKFQASAGTPPELGKYTQRDPGNTTGASDDQSSTRL
jgi:hypothetical protein